jgi:2-hydroxycyclohexanecarboxyl-CoA dehydrogenase
MKGRLERKVAVVTGGAGGIGAAVSEVFCKEGARVALVARTQESAHSAARLISERNPGVTIRGYSADLGVESEATRVIDAVVKDFGGVDVLVNNAGVRRYDSMAQASWEAWDDIVRVNLLGVSGMVGAALPHLRRSGHGSIINVSSTYAIYGS